MKKTAFTLIELLVVIVIIGILATVSVAQFNEYSKKARDAVRITGLKQLENALQRYYVDNESYPRTFPIGDADTVSQPYFSNIVGNGYLFEDTIDTDTRYGALGYVPFLVPDYLGVLPTSPNIGSNFKDKNGHIRSIAYRYRSNGADFIIHAFVEEEDPVTYQNGYFRRLHQGADPTSTHNSSVFVVKSIGAESW